MKPYRLTDDEKRSLLTTARHAIREAVLFLAPAYPDPTPSLRENRGVFVSLHIDKRLRGCIGSVSYTHLTLPTKRIV